MLELGQYSFVFNHLIHVSVTRYIIRLTLNLSFTWYWKIIYKISKGSSGKTKNT